jgi:hypothetical protein
MAGRRGSPMPLMMLGCGLAAACVLTGCGTQASLHAGSPLLPASPAQSISIRAADAATDDDPTDVPTTEAPTTAPPTTAPPTEPPTTAPPTQAPTTEAETTPPEPVPPVTPGEPESPTVTVTVTATPDAGGSGSALPWLLAGLGALVLIGLIVWLARSSSRRANATAAWRSRRLNAYAEGAALHDAILSVQGHQMQPDEAAARWADIQHRADNFNQRLYQLRETAPDEQERASVDELLVSLQALRSALDAQRASGMDWTASAASSMTAGVVRDRLNDFRMRLSWLRDPDAAGNGLA